MAYRETIRFYNSGGRRLARWEGGGVGGWGVGDGEAKGVSASRLCECA